MASMVPSSSLRPSLLALPSRPLFCSRPARACQKNNNAPQRKRPGFLIGSAVSITTELLRLFSKPIDSGRREIGSASVEKKFTRVQDVVDALSFDYQQAYFLTGRLTTSMYNEDCYFADPTISFTGRDLYEQNLKLLVPFFEEPSLTLFSIEEGVDEPSTIKASWQLRTFLKLPWRPFICVNGCTVYAFDENFKIARHVESWSITPLQAILQIFKLRKPPP